MTTGKPAATRQELVDALTVERYSGPVREWRRPLSTAAQDARELRLIVDSEKERGAA